MSCVRQWKIGIRIVGLMSNGVVVIAEEGDYGFANSQFTLAVGLPGLMALKNTLEEVIEEIKVQRKQNKKD